MRSSNRTDVIKMFEMKDKKGLIFVPTNKSAFLDVLKYALKKSFADFNFRTLTKTSDFSNEYKAYEQKIKVARAMQKRGEKDKEPRVQDLLIPRFETEFFERFCDYFNSAVRDKNGFDDWHHKTCLMFLDILNGEGNFSKYTKAYDSLKYGKAQKIVNMMFKHLYCIDGANYYEEYFAWCHMVLDNYTLEWFETRNLGKRIDSWSNIVYVSPTKDKNDYFYYQEKIRDYFTGSNNVTYKDASGTALTPFLAEFYIWPEMQWEMSAKAFIDQNLLNEMNNVGKVIAQDGDIVKFCDEIIKRAYELRAYYK